MIVLISKTCLSCLNIFLYWSKNNQGNTSEDENYINMSKGRSLLKHDECEVYGVYGHIVEKNNQGHTAKDEVEDEDYQLVKALSKLLDREYVEKVKAFYGIEDLDF